MPLVRHTFDIENHIYRVDNAFVLSTSDIIELNGLSLLQGVPQETLQWASQRGRMLHEAVCAYEMDCDLPEMTDEAMERFRFYLRWKECYDFVPCGPLERSIVYQHHGTGMLVGGTPDLIGRLTWQEKRILAVVDAKTCFRQSGKAKQMKLLEWDAQTASYHEGLAEDEELWSSFGDQEVMLRCIVHLHPHCGIEKRGEERTGHETYVFEHDGAPLWDSLVRVAYAKISAGHPLPQKR